MPRTRSRNFGIKKSRILNVAASIFAQQGYAACKLEDIADECRVSKSSIYHYFEKKEDILYELLRKHVTSLNDTIERYLANAECSDQVEYFRDFLETYLSRSPNERERHAVSLNDTRYLKRDQMVLQEVLERKNRDLIVELLVRINPGYSIHEYKVYALLLIGMINWIELWYRNSGAVSRPELYDQICGVFLAGFLARNNGEAAEGGLPECLENGCP